MKDLFYFIIGTILFTFFERFCDFINLYLTDLFKAEDENEDQNGDAKVDFGSHLVTVKSGLDFSETGLFLTPNQARESSNLQVFRYMNFYYDQTITVSNCDNLYTNNKFSY